MSLREEQCNKVCRILDDVLANRPTERDSLILAVRKVFAEPQERNGKWIRVDNLHMRCNRCDVIHLIAQYPRGNIDYCPNCGARMGVEHESN